MSGDAEPPVRTAVIGYGLAGRAFHAALVAAADGVELVAVVTADPARQAQLRTDHPETAVVASADELFEQADRYDLVVVAATNDAHVPLARAAIERGKAVVVDKPLALSAAQGADLVHAAQAAGAPLTVFQNRRWDSDQRTLRRLLEDGSLGEVLRYESRFERWRPRPRVGSWRESLPADRGGGLLLDLGSHIVDQALHLFGVARRVYAEVDARRGVSDDDVFIALEHASGVRSHLWAGALAGAPGPRLRVLGTGGAYVVGPLDGQEHVLASTGRLPAGGLHEPESAWGRLVRGEESAPVQSEPGRWDLFYPAVAAAVRGRAPVPVDPTDSVNVLRVLEAARRSAGTGQVVELTA